MDEKEWPKNSDSPTVQKALSIETLKAENVALRERLAKLEFEVMVAYVNRTIPKHLTIALTEARAFLASEDQEKKN